MKAAKNLMKILLTIALIAAILGVYKTHLVQGGATFGTTTGSLSLIAFAIVSSVWGKLMCCKEGSC